MTDRIIIRSKCSICQGTGQLFSKDGTPYVCPSCGGTQTIPTQMLIDVEVFDQILTELDYLRGKVTAIWNKVK